MVANRLTLRVIQSAYGLESGQTVTAFVNGIAEDVRVNIPGFACIAITEERFNQLFEIL